MQEICEKPSKVLTYVIFDSQRERRQKTRQNQYLNN